MFSFLKTFMEKCVYAYKNNKKFKDMSIMMFLIFVGFNISCVCLYYFDIRFEWSLWVFINLFVFVCRFLESFNHIPGDYIQPDMDKLPDKINNYSVSIQYNPPK
jgi:hypothetical protein